jgi:hypothetical protein
MSPYLCAMFSAQPRRIAEFERVQKWIFLLLHHDNLLSKLLNHGTFVMTRHASL